MVNFLMLFVLNFAFEVSSSGSRFEDGVILGAKIIEAA